MAGLSAQLPSPDLVAITAEASLIGDTDHRRDPVEQIRQELLTLQLRQADVQRRIRSVQQALAAFINLFGPQILDGDAKMGEGRQWTVTGECPKILDLCRDILETSGRWMTVRQILNIMKHNSPSALARFRNPGASVSNALRCLRRQRQVEAKLDFEGISWHWIGVRQEIEA